jgi:ABC-type transport system involved in multi-copper enzyme maturation permease subunit
MIVKLTFKFLQLVLVSLLWSLILQLFVLQLSFYIKFQRMFLSVKYAPVRNLLRMLSFLTFFSAFFPFFDLLLLSSFLPFFDAVLSSFFPSVLSVPVFVSLSASFPLVSESSGDMPPSKNENEKWKMRIDYHKNKLTNKILVKMIK